MYLCDNFPAVIPLFILERCSTFAHMDTKVYINVRMCASQHVMCSLFAIDT